jgi:hypothetical protein
MEAKKWRPGKLTTEYSEYTERKNKLLFITFLRFFGLFRG